MQSFNNISSIKTLFGLSLSPVVIIMSYLRYLCLLAHSGVHHILHCSLFWFSLSILQGSLDCPYFIGLFVFSNIYSQANRNAIADIAMSPMH